MGSLNFSAFMPNCVSFPFETIVPSLSPSTSLSLFYLLASFLPQMHKLGIHQLICTALCQQLQKIKHNAICHQLRIQ